MIVWSDVDDFETISTVTVLRNKLTGKYAIYCAFPSDAESRSEFSAVEHAMNSAASLIVDELRSRPTHDGLGGE